MKITQEQRVIMRNQKIQLILLGNKLTSIHCQFNNPNYSFINEYIGEESKQINKLKRKIDVFMKCEYNVQEYDDEEISRYISIVIASGDRSNNYLM